MKPTVRSTDLAVGAASQATRLALRVGATGWNASVAGTQRLFEAVVPRLLDALDIDDLVGRIDIDRLVRRIEIDDLVGQIDIDALVGRIDIDALVGRIDIDALVGRIDIDALMQRIDLDAVVARIDVNRIAERIDVDAVVEQTELGTIVARSTSGFASEALDTARSQAADVDTRVSRAVNRVLRRKESEMPVGPPLLTGETGTEETASESGTEAPSPDAPEAESQ
jgi:hypothetical protein